MSTRTPVNLSNTWTEYWLSQNTTYSLELDEIDKKIKEMGYSWEVEPFYMPEIKTRIAFLLDPDNNEIELIEKIN